MRTFALMLALVAGCTKPPCGGKGMVVDTTPLSGVIAEVGVPPGAYVCRGESDDNKYAATHRLVEVGKDGEEAIQAWRRQLEKAGWKDVTPFRQLTDNLTAVTKAGKKDGRCMVKHVYAKDGVPGTFDVGVSFCVDGRGWSNVTYHASR